MKKNEVAAELMKHLCSHDWHGYSQYGRLGDGEGTCDVVVDGNHYYVQQGDRDCSSAVIECWQVAGVPVEATYTGNMKSGFLNTGVFEVKPMSFTAQVGDIYLNEASHTAMCVSVVPDLLAEFSISETGGIDGAVGDQTGVESSVHGYYNYPWDCILHYTGGEESAPGTPSVSNESANDNGYVPVVNMRVMTEAHGWLDWTRDPDYAGWEDSPAVYLNVECEWPVDVQVHTEAGGWLDKLRNPNNSDDLVNGTCGDGSRINAVMMYLWSPNGDYAIKYQIKPCGMGYYDYQVDDVVDSYSDGYAGDLYNPISELKSFIVKL